MGLLREFQGVAADAPSGRKRIQGRHLSLGHISPREIPRIPRIPPNLRGRARPRLAVALGDECSHGGSDDQAVSFQGVECLADGGERYLVLLGQRRDGRYPVAGP